MKIDLIYTNDKTFLSTVHHDWRFWQTKFDNYKASLSFQDLNELIEFLKSEYKLVNVDFDQFIFDIDKLNKDIMTIDWSTNEVTLS